MAALLLAIVCANVTSLVLARGVSRRGEISLRLALGASRSRVVRLLLVEHVVLAVPGALAGLALVPLIMPDAVCRHGGGELRSGCSSTCQWTGWS